MIRGFLFLTMLGCFGVELRQIEKFSMIYDNLINLFAMLLIYFGVVGFCLIILKCNRFKVERKKEKEHDKLFKEII